MNFAYGVIAIVGVLAAVSLGLIAASPDDIIEPRVIPLEERPTVCTMQWDPMCGIDGETYGNLCMLDAVDVKLDYEGECVTSESESDPLTSAVPVVEIFKLIILKTINVIIIVGTVVNAMYLMCVNKSVPAIAGAKFVVSLKGDILSPK